MVHIFNEVFQNSTIFFQSIVTGITHHRYKNEFITCGERVLLWDANTKAPKFSYDWSTSSDNNDASVVSVQFNPVETDLFGKYFNVCISDYILYKHSQ